MAAITALNVSLGMDASNFTEGANLARAEVNRVNSIMRQSVPPAQKFQNELDLLNKTFSATGKQTKEYANAVEFLKRKHKQIPPEIDDVSRSISQLRSEMLGAVPGGAALQRALDSPLGPLLAITAAVGGAVAAFKTIKGAVDTLRDAQAEIDKTAKSAAKLGISFNELSGFQFAAAEIGGLDASQVELSIKGLLIRTSRAVQGDKTINEAFARIGVDAGKAMAAGPVESIKMIAEGMERLPTQAERLEVAMTLFGKSGTDMVSTLNAGVDVLAESVAFQEKWNGLTDAQVLGVEAANDAWGRVSFMIDGITNKLAAEMAPLFGMMAGDILGVADGFNEVDAATRKITDSMAMLYGFTVDVVTATDTLAGVLAKIASGNFSGAGIAIGGMMDSAGKAGAEALKELYRQRAELEQAAGNKDAEAARLAALQQQTEEIGNQTGAIDERTTAEMKAADEVKKKTESAWKDAETTYKKVQSELARIEKMKDDAFSKDAESALAAARKGFEESRKRDEKMRQDVAKGPASMELGSAESAKYLADQANAAMADSVIPENPTPGEAELIAEAQRQFKELQAVKAGQDTQLATLKELLVAQRENGFRRVR